MKPRYLPLIAALTLCSTAALAAGYTGPNADTSITSVKTALAARDDTPVVLQGFIVKQVGGESYEFQDASGTITVEIDNDEWPAQTIDEKTQVTLYGEVDRDLNSIKVDVERIEILH